MKITVNNVVITVVEIDYVQELSETICLGMCIKATASDGSTQLCNWRLKEESEGSSLLVLNKAFDTRNPVHSDFREWLIEKTACNKDEAIKVMQDICDEVGKHNWERYCEENRWDEEDALNWLEDYLRDSDN